MSGMWCRGLVGLMLVAAGAALELYYDLPAAGAIEDMLYQNDDDYTLPTVTEKQLPRVTDRDVMMYKILKMLQMGSPGYYSNRIPDLRNRQNQFTDLSEGSMSKRISGLASRPDRFRFRPQFRNDNMKSKKEGKPGSNQICYFKLCSFAPPTK